MDKYKLDNKACDGLTEDRLHTYVHTWEADLVNCHIRSRPGNEGRHVTVCGRHLVKAELWVCDRADAACEPRAGLWATSDLHEHAEAGFEQVCEAAGHVLNVGTFEPVRVEDFLQDLPQERVIGRLQNTTAKNNNNT